jgi:hypothetical protein
MRLKQFDNEHMNNAYDKGKEETLQKVVKIIDKYIEATKHDLKYECEDEQQELMSLYLLKELQSLKSDIQKDEKYNNRK